MASIVRWTLEVDSGPFSVGMDKASKKVDGLDSKMEKSFGDKSSGRVFKLAKRFAFLTAALALAAAAFRKFGKTSTLIKGFTAATAGMSAGLTTAGIAARGFLKAFAISKGLGALTAAAAAAAVAFAVLANKVTDARLAMKKLENQSGLTGNQMRSLRLEAGLVGVELEALIPKNLSERLLDAQIETSEQARLFKQLGIETAEASGKLRDTGDVFLEILAKAKTAEDSVAGMGAAIKLLGGVSEEALAALDAQAILDISEASHTFGAQTGPEAIAASKDWKRALDGMSTLFDRMKNALVNLGLPTATKWVVGITNVMHTWGVGIRVDIEILKLLGGVVGEVFKQMRSFGTRSVNTMKENIKGLKDEFVASTKEIFSRAAQFERDVNGPLGETGDAIDRLKEKFGDGVGFAFDAEEAYASLGFGVVELTDVQKEQVGVQRDLNEGLHDALRILSALTPQQKAYNEAQQEAKEAAEENLESQASLSLAIIAAGDTEAEAFARQQVTKREELQATIDMVREDFDQGFIDREQLMEALESDSEARKQLEEDEAAFAIAAANEAKNAKMAAFAETADAAVRGASAIMGTIGAVQKQEANAAKSKLDQIQAEADAEKQQTGVVSNHTARRLEIARKEFNKKSEALRKGAVARKATSIAEILTQNALAIAVAATAAIPPLNLPFIAAAIATGLAALGQATAVAIAPLPRLHDGGFASDEFQATLQRGEAILSQRGVEALGEERIGQVNDGRTIPSPASDPGLRGLHDPRFDNIDMEIVVNVIGTTNLTDNASTLID